MELVVTNGGTEDVGGSLVALADRGFGFFDEASARVVSLPRTATPPVFPPGGGVVLTTGGQLVRLESAAPIGNFGRIRAIDALADGRLVAVREDGSVAVLARDLAGQFEVEVELLARTGIPSEPSALEVLETDSGLRALVTTAGSDTLFVFDLPPARPVELSPPPADVPVASTAADLGSGTLVVVVTQLATGLPDERPRQAGPSGGDVEGPARAIQPVGGEAEPEGDLEAEGPTGETTAGSADAAGELERTRLYRATDEPPLTPVPLAPPAADPPAAWPPEPAADAPPEGADPAPEEDDHPASIPTPPERGGGTGRNDGLALSVLLLAARTWQRSHPGRRSPAAADLTPSRRPPPPRPAPGRR